MTDYTKTGKPEDNTRGISKQLRDEFTLIETAVNSKLNKNLAVLNGTEAQGATVNDFVVTVSPAITAYTTGSSVTFLATHANTGASTLKISALTAKTFKDVDGSALSSGDIASGSVVTAYYDGTDFFLTSGNDRVARSGDIYSGAHDFTGATITVPAPTSGSAAVTRDYMDAVVMASGNLPDPAAHSGELLSSDGVSGAWITKINTTVMSLKNGADPTKLVAFDLSGMTTGTTKTLLFNDNSFNFTDPTDPTKKAHVVVSGVTAGQDRSLTIADRNITLDTPSFRWLESLTASSSATLDFTAFDSAKYSDYLIILSGMDLATTNADLLLQLTIGGTLRTANYYYHTNISTHTAATYVGLNGSNAGSIVLADDLSNKPDTLPNLNINLYLFNVGDTAKYPMVKWTGVSSMGGAGGFKEASGVGGNSNIGAVTTARLLASSGNIKDGTGHLYGIRRS